MAIKKRWHFSVFSTESVKPMTLSISKKLGIGLVVFAVALVCFLVISVIMIGYNQDKIIKANQILTENRLLRSRINDLSVELDSILTKLRLMEEWEDQIRVEKNFKTINKEIREMGIGGLPQVDTTFMNFSRDLNLQYNLVLGKLTQLKSKLEFDYGSHQELLDNVKLKELLYRNTPSIYPTYGRISDGFGWRLHPITKTRSFHYGIDFGNKTGTPIYATADGVIKDIGTKKNIGKYIAIGHKFGYQTTYAHLHKILVKKGDAVKRGEIIALMGNTGRSTGTHLHYEVLRYNKYRDPYDYLNKLEEDIILTNN
ncbi:MAG: M23 family metallopeptidase [Candidatus Cloacimonetes bacterium]|nr:M23 family metallopeptidase [Candidatus Cloacimonadota bacterium]